MALRHGDSRYLYTGNARQERLWRRQAFCVRGRQIYDQADDGLIGEVAAANAEPANFDQAGQSARRPDYKLPLACFKMDTIVADQQGAGYLP